MTAPLTGNKPVDTILQLLAYADMAADVALPLAGHPELAVLADAVNALAQKIAGAVSDKQHNIVAAEVAAADLAAKAAEVAAGLK